MTSLFTAESYRAVGDQARSANSLETVRLRRLNSLPLLPMKTTLLVLLLFLANQAHAAVWTATSQWSSDAEQRYQDWVRTSWNIHTFEQPGPLQGLKLDCADAVYSMRLLFAYQNRLPFAVKDPSSNRVISNDMSRFDKVGGSDQRLRAFALYLYDVLGTQSLADDSYPLAANRSAIKAGVFLKTDKASHHSWTVRDLSRAGVPYLIYASRPAATKLLDRHYFPTMGFLWGQQDANGRQIDANLQDNGSPAAAVGFRMYRYPQDLLKPEWQVPGYSTDQFSMRKIQWAKTMQRSLQLAAETSDELALRLLGEACKEVSDRVPSVQNAVRAQSSSTCFNAVQYDDLSTPSKDSRARGVFKDLKNAASASLTTPVREKVSSVLENRNSSYCVVNISSSQQLSLGQAIALSSKWSSNPNDTLGARWGLERSPTSRAARCPVY